MDEQAQRAKAKILLVDDDKHTLTIAKAMLRHAGYENVSGTNNPYSALKKMERKTLDIVILDWKIPGLSGLEVLKAIRAIDTMLPIVMFTSHCDRQKVVEAMEAGATDYIVKPFTQKILINKIEEILEKVEAKRREAFI